MGPNWLAWREIELTFMIRAPSLGAGRQKGGPLCSTLVIIMKMSRLCGPEGAPEKNHRFCYIHRELIVFLSSSRESKRNGIH